MKKLNRKESIQLIEIIILLNDFFKDSEKVHLWLNIENLNFGGARPIDLITLGKGKKVIEFINSVNGEKVGNNEVNRN